METVAFPANKKTLLIIIIVIAALIIGGVFIYQKYYQKAPLPKEEPATLGEQIYEQVQNPIEKLPETNPYEAKTNPFEEAKTNPFKDVYTNPFE